MSKIKNLNVKVLVLDPKSKTIALNSGALMQGFWKVFGRTASYNVNTQKLSVGCRTHTKSFLEGLENTFTNKRKIKIIVSKNAKSFKVLKTNRYLEESDSFYISTSGKSFNKKTSKIVEEFPPAPFSSTGKGDKLKYQLGTNGYYGDSVLKTKTQIIDKSKEILEVIDFIENNQVL